jgi:ABC-2 type transport system permease protein
VQFLVVIPPRFGQRLVRGEQPALLLAADATDPSASGNALAALKRRPARPCSASWSGRCAACRRRPAVRDRGAPALQPRGLSRYNIVPGLVGTILTMTMVMLTSLAMTRERERGTMENLLATPVLPAR